MNQENVTNEPQQLNKGEGITPIRNFGYLQYTFNHRIAIRYVLQKFKDRIHPGIYPALEKHVRFHDLDKSMLYLFADKPLCSKYHKLTARHHMREDNIVDFKTTLDFYEAILDYESSAYTKPDKPENAWDTIQHASWMPKEYRERLEALTRTLGIAYSYRNSPEEPEWVAFRKTQPEATFENILAEIFDYQIHEGSNSSIAEIARTENLTYLTPELIRFGLDKRISDVEDDIRISHALQELANELAKDGGTE